MLGTNSPSRDAEKGGAQPKRRIAYILSLKGGLPSFNYREIESMYSYGFEIHLFPTKISQGIYNPKSSWPVHRPSVPRAVLSVVSWTLRRPVTFMRLLSEAAKEKAFTEFVLASQYAREMKASRIDMIHCHFADRKMFVTYFCSQLLGLSYTVTLHSHELVFYAHRKLFVKALKGSSKVIVQCNYNRDNLISTTHIDESKIELIRAHVPVENFMTDNRMKVLTVAKFYDYKGYDVLMAAARLLKDQPVVFWVVGDGPVDVKGMAGDLVAQGVVKLLGSVDEEILRILYQSCDVFCLPSKTAPSGQKEGLPMSLMEAMAYSKPIVSTMHAGIPELVESVVVPEGDPEAIAKGIRSYMLDPELRRHDGQRNRERVEKLHGADNLKKLAQVLESVR